MHRHRRHRQSFDSDDEKNGISLWVRQKMLNMLNPFLPEYLEPDYLVKKIRFMLRYVYDSPKKDTSKGASIESYIQKNTTSSKLR